MHKIEIAKCVASICVVQVSMLHARNRQLGSSKELNGGRLMVSEYSPPYIMAALHLILFWETGKAGLPYY